MVDCQYTFRVGVMHLTNLEPAILEAQQLLQMALDLNIPFHAYSACMKGWLRLMILRLILFDFSRGGI